MDGSGDAGGEEVTFLWRVTIPIAFYFYVVGIFFIWVILWTVLIIRRVAVSLWAIRLVPLFLIGFYLVLLPFQPSQQDLIEITETVLDCIDTIWNRGVRLFLNDVILCANPACTIYNFFVRLGAALINLVVDPIRSALSKRFFFEGEDPPPSGEFAFDFFEEACAVIETVFELILDVVELLVERIWAFIMFFYDQLIVEMNFDPSDLFFEFMNFFFECILDIPCMKFDNVEAFAVSIVNCVCQFSPLFDQTAPDPPCDGEIDDADEILSGLVCCIGLGCFLNDDGSFPSIPDEFATNFVENCLGGIGGIPDLSDLADLADIDIPDIPDLRDEPEQQHHNNNNYNNNVRRLKRGSRVVAQKLREFKKKALEPLTLTQRMSGGMANWIYGRNSTAKAKDQTRDGFQGFFNAVHAVFEQIFWDSEEFNFQMPSYGEIRRTLYVEKAPAHIRTIGNAFYDYLQMTLNSKPRMELFVKLRTITTLCLWRTLAPHKLEETKERLKAMGPQYETAVHSSLETLRKVDPQFDNMTAILRKVYWKRGGVLKNHEHPTRPGSHHSAIIDSMDVLNMLGVNLPRHLGHNITAVRVVSRGRNLEIHTFHGASGPNGATGTTQVAMTVANRVPWAAILIPILKNWQLFFAAIVPFVTSDYGIFVINSYIKFLGDIFGDIFQEPLDIDAGDLLDIAIEFSDITLNNLFLGLNKLIRFLLCRFWGFVISGLMRLIPGVGLVFGMLFQSASFFTDYCPPQPLIVDDQPTQNPAEYVLDMLDCFGRPFVNESDLCDPFEITPPLMCTTKADCPGEPPCRCRDSAQFPSLFWSFEDNTPCPMDSGFCMCYPLLPCGMSGDTEFFPPFRFPTFDLSAPFGKDCVKEFGYRLTNIIVYPWPPPLGKLVSTFKSLIDDTWNNFIIWVKYPTRQTSAGNLLDINTWRALIWIGVLVFILGNYLTGIVIVAVLTFITFALPIISEIIIDETVPFLEGIGGKIANEILDFVRFPNFTNDEPLGHPVSGENICWLVNTPTFLGAAGLLYIFFLVLYHFLVVGALFGIFAFLFETIAIPFRIIFACCWYNDRTERRSEFRQRILAESLALSQAGRELMGRPPPPEEPPPPPVRLAFPEQRRQHGHDA